MLECPLVKIAVQFWHFLSEVVFETHVFSFLAYTLNSEVYYTRYFFFLFLTTALEIFRTIRPKLNGNCVFLQNFHTKTLGETAAFYAVITRCIKDTPETEVRS